MEARGLVGAIPKCGSPAEVRAVLLGDFEVPAHWATQGVLVTQDKALAAALQAPVVASLEEVPATIIRDPALTVVGFDGSCSGNGTQEARGGYAVVGGCGALGTFVHSRKVEPFEYEWSGLEMVPRPERSCPVTNNRAEFLGGIHAIARLLLAGPLGVVRIVTDSMLFKNTVTQWYPARLRKGTERELKNLDLVTVAYDLWERLKAQCTPELVHIRSHKAPPKGYMPHFEWRVNDLADLYANAKIDQAFAI